MFLFQILKRPATQKELTQQAISDWVNYHLKRVPSGTPGIDREGLIALISDKLKAGSTVTQGSVNPTTKKRLTEWVIKDGNPIPTAVNVGVEPYPKPGEPASDFYRDLGKAIIQLSNP